MALNWKDFSGSDYFKGLPEPDQGAARQRFFDDQVAPRFAPEQRESALAEFNRRTMTPATVAAPAQAPASIQRPQANVAARAAVAPPVAEQAAMPQRPVRPGQVQPAAAEPAIAAPAGGAGFVEGMKDFGRTAVKSVVQGIPEAAANLADYIDTPEFDASGRQISDDGALSKWARATRAAAEKRGEPWQESTFGQEARAKDDMSWRGGAGAAGESMGLSWGPGLAGAAAGAAIGSMAGGVGAIPGAAAGYAIGSLATLPLFFGAQAKDTYDRVFKQAKIDNPELDDESAHDKAVVAGGFTGLIEAAGERVSDIVGGKLFRLMPPGVKNGMVRAATKSFQGVRPMIADMLKIVGTEVGIELAQGASQSAVEASYGVGEGPTWQNQKGVIVPTIIMSLVGGGAAQGVSAAARYRTAKLLQDPARDPEQRLIAARNVAGAIHQQDPELAKLFLGEAQNLIAARKPVIAEGDQFYRDLKPLAQREEDQRMAAGEDMPSEEARTAAFGEAPADVPRGTEIPPEAFAQPEGPEAADTLATDENGDIIIEDGGDAVAPGAEIPADRFARPEDAPPAEPDVVPGVAPPTEQPITDAAAVAPPQEPQAVEPAPLAAPAENGSTLQGEMVEPLNPEARKQHMNAIGANLKVLRAEREAAKKAGDEALMAEVDDEIQATAVNFKRLANNQAPLPTPREQAAGSTQNLGQDPAQNLGQVPAMPEAPALEPAAARPKNDGIDLADEQPVKALDDERMQDPDFRNWMESAVGGLVSVKDGNLGLAVDPNFIKGESDRGDEVRMVRSSSVNPPWFQEIAAAENVSVDGLRGIVKKAMTGAKLGVRQDRAVRKLMDAITDERIGELQDWGRGLGMSAEEVAGLHNDNPVAHMRALEVEVSARQKKAADAEVEQQWAEQDAVVAGKKAFTPDVVLGEDAPDVDGYDFSDQEAIEGHVYATAVGWGVPVAQLDELHAQAPDAESFLSSVRNAIREIRANEKIRSDQGEAGSVADIGGPGAPESGESAAAEAERLAALEQARAEAIPALEEYLGTDWRKDGERRARLAAASPDELVEEVYRDKMTGLLNKRAWNEDTTKAGFEKQGRRSKPYAIAYIDLDGLKFLNDQMGHSAGDELLANFGKAMKAAGIDGYHISGDEFGAIFDTEAEAREAMSRLEQAVASSVVRGKSRDGRGITNAGIAFSYGVGPTADAADMAMQANKADREAQGLRGGARGGMPATASYDVLEQYDQADIDAKAAADKKRETDEAKAAARQKADDERGGFTLAGSNRQADQAAARGQDELFGATPPKAKPAAPANTIFTEDAAEKARAILRAKLGQLNTGIDPEIVQAGITLAGYHIEKGARTFSAYAKAMLADLGEIVRPYLKSWYVAVKLDPRAAGLEGMDSLASVEAADLEKAAAAPAKPAGPIAVRVFASGMSRVGDLSEAFAQGNHVGVDAGQLSANAVEAIAKGVVDTQSNVFVDSGAFSLFRANLRAQKQHLPLFDDIAPEWKALDFGQVLARYNDIIAAVARLDQDDNGASRRLHFVMPDVVGSQEASLEALREHVEEVTDLDLATNRIFPLQAGAKSLLEMYDEIAKILGRGDIVVGIPSNAEAAPNDQVEELLRERGDEITGVHFLGAGSEKTLAPRMKAVIAAGYDGEVSGDSNILRSKLLGSSSRAEALRAALADMSPEAGDPINAAAHQAATSPENALPQPTDAQKEAGNYQKGHITWNGLDITIENPAGSKRRPEWPTLVAHYGYLKRTEGADGEHVDVFINPDEASRTDSVVVIDQLQGGKKGAGFDEHKVMLGFKDKAAAIAAYKANFTKGWHVGPAVEMTVDEFNAWLAKGDQTAPIAAASTPESQKSKGHIAWIDPTPANPARRELVARDDGKIGIADADNAIDMATGNRFSRSQALDTPENRARLLQGLAPEAKDAPPAADEDLSSAADPLAPTGDEAFDKALQNRTIRFAMTRAKMTEKRGEYNGVPYVTRTWTASVKLRGRSERDALPGYLKVNRTLPEPVGEDTSFILSTRTGSNVGDAMNAEIQISRTEFDYQDGKSEAPAAAPTASEPKPADLLGEEQKPKTRIADFGERIEGAAKYRDRYSDQMTEAMEADIAAVPLSESWPEPDYEKMLEEGADPGIVAFVHAARDEIPVKPKKRWKVAGWTEAVRLLRDVSNGLINGSIPADKFRETLAKPEFMRVARDVGGRADLYQAVGHGVSLKGVTLRARSFSRLQPDNSWKEIRDWGVEREAKASAFGNWPQELGVGNTREEAIAAFKAKHAEMAGAEKPDAQTSFEIYRYRANPGVVVIGKKIGKDRVDLAQFPTLAEARDYLKNSHDDLVAKLEAYKKIPRERRLTNEPRVGVNHRNGSNVTAEQFQETFGFRGGQFGSSLLSSQKEAQTHLNEAYDALMDMAGVLGVPPRALSLNGELALAFGARGKGGKDAASAHYEPDTKGAVTDSTVVINLTRKHGAGSLAHEWFHALDNYFARARKERGGMLTERPFPRGDGVRPEMVAAFKNLMDTIKRTTLEQRSMALDKRRTKLYWSTGLEMAARSFESYIIEKLRDQGASNDYLANIVSPEYWAAEEALRDFAETGNMGEQQEQTYPYPTAAEIPAIRAAFDHFFQTIETKETDKGIAIQEGEGVYSVESRGKKYGDRASQPIDDLFGLFGDPYENAEQRPGTTEKQRDLGRDALRDLSRRIGLDSVARRFNAGGSAPSILGAGLVRNFVAGQPNSLIGGTIQSPRDLAALAQVYRDPRFETFRIAYLKGDTVVGEAGYSSRMPGIVNMGNDFITDVSNDMARFGADGYYAMHNHPSGKSAPSTADANLTILLDRKVPGFLGHVVIDHNEYSVLDASGWHKTIQDDKLGSADFRADPVVQSDLLGAEVKGPRDVVDLAKRVQKPDMATVVMTVAGETGRVNLVVDLPADALRSHAPRMGALIRRMARGSGSGGNRFLVLPDGYPKAAFQHLITYGVFTDVVGADGTSSVEELPSLYDVFRRRDVLTKGLKGARVYEPEALYSRGAEEEEDAISKAKQAAIAARNAFRAIDRTKKIEDADSYFDLSSKMSDAKSAFADALGQIPADQFALRGMTSDGRILLLTPSAQRPGFWQLTRFDINGEPWGDTQYPTREQATREFLDDATPESVTDHSAQFSRGDSAKGHTEAALYDRLRGLFGPKFMDRLFQTGRFRVITGQDAANILGAADTDALKSGGAVRGFYHRGNGITYLVADSIPAGFTDAQLKGLMRHEIGVHALKAGRDSAGWQKILGEIDRLINAGDKAAHAAFLRAGAAGTRDVDLLEEVAGYLVEDAPDSSIVRRILAWLKDQVFKLTGMQLKLTDADIVAMARAALRRAPDLLAGIGTAPRLTPVYSAPAPIWVSALRQRIAEQGAKTRTGNDWSAWLQGNAAKLGIKRDEIEWSGITDYLTARGKDKLTTAEITDWLSANGVQVQEVNLGQSAGAQESVGEIRARLTQALEAEGYGIEFDGFDDAEVTYLDEDGDAVQFDELPLRIQAIVDRNRRTSFLRAWRPSGPRRSSTNTSCRAARTTASSC
jgi:diguanylate cyclase (GGDEF)-like protein